MYHAGTAFSLNNHVAMVQCFLGPAMMHLGQSACWGNTPIIKERETRKQRNTQRGYQVYSGTSRGWVCTITRSLMKGDRSTYQRDITMFCCHLYSPQKECLSGVNLYTRSSSSSDDDDDDDIWQIPNNTYDAIIVSLNHPFPHAYAFYFFWIDGSIIP